jgi:hypothetical protein
MTTELGTMSQQFGAALPDDDIMDIDIDIDMDEEVEPIPEPDLEVLLRASLLPPSHHVLTFS